MKLITEVQAAIAAAPGTRAAGLLAQALASACSSRYSAPPLLDLAVSLDDTNKALVWRLLNITAEPDYSNSAQDRALNWLRVAGLVV